MRLNEFEVEKDKDDIKINAFGVIFRTNRFRGVFNVYEVIVWFIALYYLFSSEIIERSLRVMNESLAIYFLNISPGIKAFIFGLIPLASTLIYRISPVQLIFRRLLNPYQHPLDDVSVVQKKEDELPAKEKSKEELAEFFLLSLVNSSSNLARDIFSRGSLYLFFGVIFSVGGMSFFFSQVHEIPPTSDFKITILTLAPKFGILFFIELISFFFLKQYRVTMDEFRYYEAIKRSREETLAIVKIISINNSDIDYISLLDKLKFSSNVGKLESGQTTEILEARKFDKDELDFLAKVVEAVTKKGT